MTEFKYPAFLSYSSADNQSWGGWLNDFHKVFSVGLAGELKIQGAEQAIPFYDIDQLQGTTGSVEAILKERVESSFALFIFLGRGYVKSQWCCKELEFFSAGLAGELKIHGAEQAVPFYDIDQLQGTTGSVEAILKERVESSFALFIFLGRGYVKSE